jgi:1,4-dihydroxy-2-naphthoate octaprenyltransferase
MKFNSGTFKNIFSMSRPPFHIVGVMPFILGTVIANRLAGVFDLAVFLIAAFAVIMIMLLTYYNGEYYDVKEDKLAGQGGKNLFSGGSQVIAQKRLPRKYAKTGSYVALALAVVAGIVLQFYYKTGVWTIPLGVVGMFLGYFYSSPPFRWVSRGVGEIFIGFCYGWLPVAVAFYIQTQRFDVLVNWVSIPIALTIFNVILINEFPDYNADKQTGKRNIVVRLGKSRSAIIYITATVLTWVFYGISIYAGIPVLAAYIYIPFFLASFFVIISLIRKAYLDHKKLEMLCGLTIIINIGVTLSLILGVSFGM